MKDDTPLTQPGSRAVRYELIDWDGKYAGIFSSETAAASAAYRYWPEQERDYDRAGCGWDIQIAKDRG